jgi:hypothetical protein
MEAFGRVLEFDFGVVGPEVVAVVEFVERK